MLTHDALKRDTARRVTRVQAMMKDMDLDVMILTGQAMPGGMGAIRYLTHAHLWGGVAYAVLGADDPHPWLQVWSSYQAVWSRNETTTLPERVLSPYEDIVAATADNAKEYATGSKRIGMVNMSKLMGLGTYQAFVKELEGYELVEVTNEFNEIRQIKSPFELEAIQQNGAILDSAMDVFKDVAAVGARYWDACAAVEGYIKSFGAFWGRTKLAIDGTPYTVPTPKDLRMGRDDIINFEIVYESPYGYWLEMTTVFSFRSPARRCAGAAGWLSGGCRSLISVGQSRQHLPRYLRCQRQSIARSRLPGGWQAHARLPQHRSGRQRRSQLDGRARFRSEAEYGTLLSSGHRAGKRPRLLDLR